MFIMIGYQTFSKIKLLDALKDSPKLLAIWTLEWIHTHDGKPVEPQPDGSYKFVKAQDEQWTHLHDMRIPSEWIEIR